jgi:hypothetical protein
MGLLALWREAILAKHVLEGITKGYTYHPQLDRFKNVDNPVGCIKQYLTSIYQESLLRGYEFDLKMINSDFEPMTLHVTIGQMEYEKSHLLGKLKLRDSEKYDALLNDNEVAPHPLFKIIDGEIETWEKINTPD